MANDALAKFNALARKQKISRDRKARVARAIASATRGRLPAPNMGLDEFALRDSREAVGLAVNTVQRLAADGKIKMRKDGNWAIINKPSVEAYLAASKAEHRERMNKARRAMIAKRKASK